MTKNYRDVNPHPDDNPDIRFSEVKNQICPDGQEEAFKLNKIQNVYE